MVSNTRAPVPCTQLTQWPWQGHKLRFYTTLYIIALSFASLLFIQEGYDRSRHSHSVPAVLTSTLQRTIQTAAHLPFQQQHLPALNEINAGIAELMTYKQVQQHYPEVAAARSRDKLRFRCVSGG